MKRTFVIIGVIAGLAGSCVAVVVILHAWPSRRCQDSSPFVLTLTLDKSVVSLSEDPTLWPRMQGRVDFDNCSETDVVVWSCGTYEKYLEFSIRDSDGRECAEGSYGGVYVRWPENRVKHVFTARSSVSSYVDPGRLLRKRKDLEPGWYAVQATFDDGHLKCQSNEVRFRIVP